MTKWKRAAIHLECATDSVSLSRRIEAHREAAEKLETGEITPEELAAQSMGGLRDVRFYGSAVFIRFRGRRYLITARHVLWDKIEAERELSGENDLPGFESAVPEIIRRYFTEERSREQIYSIIFRVPSIDEILAHGDGHRREFLMNLGAGASFTVPYTFSHSDLDLAVVSLDQRDRRFADDLEANGYVPVEAEDIAEGPSEVGADVLTIGFPVATSTIAQLELEAARRNWSSGIVSEPVYSFGKVAMDHRSLPFFWADMSIYPGNSGGGVYEGDKLVGIVSAQATVPLDAVPDVTARIPFGKVIKAGNLVRLIELQIEKDGFHA